MEDLEKKNITRIVSTLLFLAHIAYKQKVLTEEMNPELLKKCEIMAETLGGPEADEHWSKQFMEKIGLARWFPQEAQ